MKRNQALTEYSIYPDSIRICTPGKFEGCAIYVPHLWEAVLNGEGEEHPFQTEDDPQTTRLEITAEDRAEYPELNGIDFADLWEDDQGFVYCATGALL